MTERRVLDAVQQHFAIAGPTVAMLVAALLGREAKAMPSCLFEVGQKRYSRIMMERQQPRARWRLVHDS